MALQVKFPFGRGQAPLHTCGICGYMTRHRAMYERHMKHCNDKTLPTANRTDLKTKQLPSPPVCRNYRCEKCGFATSKSARYLQHRRESHGENFSIYPCDQCEYASRHKSKVIRHRSLVHRDAPTDPSFPQELDHESKSSKVSASTSSKSLTEVKYEDIRALEEEDIYMQPDENQNTTPVKNLNRNIQVKEELEDFSSPENVDVPLEPQCPDPTENAYNYITGASEEKGVSVYNCTLCSYGNSHKWKVATHVRNVHMRKTLFKCPHCEFVTERKIEWCVHKTTHTQKVVHSCQECSYRTTMKRNFERHLGHHNLNGHFKCTMCTYSSTGEAAVQRHMAEYHPSPDKQRAIDSIHTSTSKKTTSPPPASKVIGTLYRAEPVYSHSRATSHSKSSHSQEVQCRLCNVWFKNETRLRIHMVSHSDEAPFVCSVCNLRYKRPADMNRHMRRKHGLTDEDSNKMNDDSESDQDQPLNLCIKRSDDEFEQDPDKPLDLSCKSSSSPSPTPSPMYRSCDVKCSHCSYIAKWPSDLRRHMLVHSVEKRYRCSVCSRRYKYQFDLNMHMRKSHHLPAGKTRVTSSNVKPKPGQSNSRSLLKVDYTKIRQLRRSQSKEAQLRVEKQYSEGGIPDALRCSHCDYVGKYPAEVERHEQLHTGDHPYLCLFCTYRTFWKGDMKRHLAKHHESEVKKYGELPELVNLCYKPALDYDDKNDAMIEADEEDADTVTQEEHAQRSSLYEEMEPYLREISGRKLYKCTECNLAYDNPSKLKTHLGIHDLKRYVCAHCGIRSNWRVDISKHITKHHPGAPISIVELTEDEARATEDDHLDSSSHSNNSRSSSRSHSPLLKEAYQNSVQDLEAYVNMKGLDDYARVMNPDSIEDDIPEEPVAYKKPHSLLDSIPGGVNSLGLPEANVDNLVATVAGGRYRRFKCTKCGKRSNWKWDIRKHIRSNHPGADVIEMTEEDAKATFHEVLQTKPKDEKDFYRFYDEDSNQSLKAKWRPYKCSECGKRSNWKWDLRKHLVSCSPDAEMIILSEKEAEATFVAECSHYVDKKSEERNEENMEESRGPSLSPKVKRYKCSVCPYRSDYRSDISRHLKRKHYKAKGKILILGSDYAAATLPGYKETWAMKKFVISPEKVQHLQEEDNHEDLEHCVRVVDPEEEERPRNPSKYLQERNDNVETENPSQYLLTRSTPSRSVNKLWQCSKCDYKNGNKMTVISHFKTHGQGRAFQCKVCAYTSDYRGSIYRHVKAIHKRSDYQNVINYCALMEIQQSPMDISQGESPEDVTPDTSECVYVVKMYQCQLCPSKTVHKHNLVRHIKEKHPEIADPHGRFIEVESISKKPPALGGKAKTDSALSVEGNEKKFHRCNFCPFKTTKTGLLKIHQQYHKVQNSEQLKCKFCPYYISTMRRLIQHMKLHQESNGEKDLPEVGDWPERPRPSQGLSPTKTSGKARHFCDKCPYVSINKNDFIYHKQFHRPKPAAPFKCDLCPYWVSLRRLLTQHKKVHTPEYKVQYYPNDMLSASELAISNSQILPLSSPAKSVDSEISLESDNMVQIANIKQQIIMSKIKSVPITPEKLRVPTLMDRADDRLMRGYVVGSSGDILTNKSYQKMHTCQYCPYTNVRYANLRLHERMHGRPYSNDLYQCQFCDYQVSNKGLLAHHIRVHSTQYQPEHDDINDVELMDDNEEFIEKNTKMPDVETEQDEGNKNNDLNQMKFPERILLRSDPNSQLYKEQLPNKSEYYIKLDENVGGPVLEKAMMKKWCCEQCPYATIKRTQFEKHILLHGSKQKYACEYCDYSVPGYHLLLQHKKLHMTPNPNLLSTQSISNLQRLPEIPADVAAAVHLTKHENLVHDNMDLYENSPDFVEPRRLFRCDRCPYSNSRRDHLLSHLKFHMISSGMKCPYCDYSVSKVHLLNQHIKVHFSTPGTEMSAEPKPKSNGLVQDDLEQPEFFTALELKQTNKPEAPEDLPTDLSLKSPVRNEVEEPSDASLMKEMYSMEDMDTSHRKPMSEDEQMETDDPPVDESKPEDVSEDIVEEITDDHKQEEEDTSEAGCESGDLYR